MTEKLSTTGIERNEIDLLCQTAAGQTTEV